MRPICLPRADGSTSGLVLGQPADLPTRAAPASSRHRWWATDPAEAARVAAAALRALPEPSVIPH
jgi:hypothetical protein